MMQSEQGMTTTEHHTLKTDRAEEVGGTVPRSGREGTGSEAAVTDILTDMKRNIAAAGDVLMYSPPLTIAQAREMVVIVESLREDKRSLSRIVDDLSAQVNALNQMLQGVIEAEEWDRELTTPVTAEVMADMKHRIANWGKRTAVGGE